MNEDMISSLSALATGLYLLTTGTKDEPYGMIVSWVTQAGYDPPLVMAAVRVNRFIHGLVPKFGCFGLNVLPADDDKIMTRIKKSPPGERFSDLEVFTAVTKAPLVKEALACLDCRLAGTIRPGDHTLFLGRVEEGIRLRDGRPMTSLDYGHAYLGRY